MRGLAECPGREFALPSAVEDAFGQLALFGIVRHGHVLLSLFLKAFTIQGTRA